VPAASILVAEGVRAVAARLPTFPARLIVGTAAATAIVALPAAYAAKHLVQPRHHEEIKQGLEYIRDHRRPGDVVFVDYDAQFALRYYRECGCVPAATVPKRFVVGRPFREDPLEYLRQAEMLKARRVWILYTHTKGPADAAFHRAAIDRLDRRARRLAGFDGDGVHTYLYAFKPRAGRGTP
jgi:hypothetical protein